MTARSTVEAARAFLRAVWDGPPPSEAELARALDELAVAYHLSGESQPSDRDDEPPKIDWKETQSRVVERFPDFGFYSVADPLKLLEPPTISDAIDDIADITGDLREVVWRAENISEEDAEWYFRLLYFHWGTHMRDLASYLHARFTR